MTCEFQFGARGEDDNVGAGLLRVAGQLLDVKCLVDNIKSNVQADFDMAGRV